MISYAIWISRSFLWCYVAGKKSAGLSKTVKNRVLESCSNIFFTLDDAEKDLCLSGSFERKFLEQQTAY